MKRIGKSDGSSLNKQHKEMQIYKELKWNAIHINKKLNTRVIYYQEEKL